MKKRGTQKEREARRFKGISLLSKGHRVRDVAKALGVTSGAVSQWKAAFEEEGENGLRSKPMPGASPRLSEKQRNSIPGLLLKGPQAHGFPTNLWTLERVAEVIERKFGIKYHPAHVSRILGSLGWSCQKPERLARERDEGKIQTWRCEKWPAVKKGRKSKGKA